MPQPNASLLLALTLIVPLTSMTTGCATTGGKVRAIGQPDAETVYEAGREALAQEDYGQAVGYFRRMAVDHPDSEHTPQARIELAYAYFKAGDISSAVATAERFIRDNPDHPSLDYLYYLRGLAEFDRAMSVLAEEEDATGIPDSPSAELALRYFSELIARFPDSKYSEDARNRITHLNDGLAQRQLRISKYYLGRGDYANAGLYARVVIDKYPGSAAAREAAPLVNMAYRMLSLEESPASTAGEPPAQETAPPGEDVKDVDWLLQQPPQSYTIQLLSTSDREALLLFIRRHRLKRELAYFETSHDDKLWYSLVYGIFPSPADARVAAEKLPPSLRDQRPWIRKVEDVQAAIASRKTADSP